MNEELKNRKSLYILLSFLVAISIWIYVDEFGNDGKPRETVNSGEVSIRGMYGYV